MNGSERVEETNNMMESRRDENELYTLRWITAVKWLDLRLYKYTEIEVRMTNSAIKMLNLSITYVYKTKHHLSFHSKNQLEMNQMDKH